MTVLRPLRDDEFDPGLLEACQFFKGPLGVIPNSVRTMARRPAIALFGFLNRWNDSMGTALEDLPMESARRNLAHTGWDAGKHGDRGSERTDGGG
jgi:hypothetical protein